MGSPVPPYLSTIPSPRSQRDLVKPKSHPVPPLLKPLNDPHLTWRQGQRAHQDIKAPSDLSLASLLSTLPSLTLLQPQGILAGS